MRIQPRSTWVTTPLLFALFIALWKGYVAAFNVSKFILPAPEDVWWAIVELFRGTRILHHARVTLTETLVGFGIAVVIGVALGVVLGKVRPLERMLNPFIVATQVVPKVALIPLFIVWFGFGMTSKIVVAAVLAFFPVLTNTMLGIKSIEEGHKEVMQSLNASRLSRLRLMELRSALPYILTGMELGIVLAIIGAVVGEYLGGSEGLGYLVISSLNAYQVERMFAVLVLLTAVGFLLYAAVLGLKRLAIPWHSSSSAHPGGEG